MNSSSRTLETTNKAGSTEVWIELPDQEDRKFSVVFGVDVRLRRARLPSLERCGIASKPELRYCPSLSVAPTFRSAHADLKVSATKRCRALTRRYNQTRTP